MYIIHLCSVKKIILYGLKLVEKVLILPKIGNIPAKPRHCTFSYNKFIISLFSPGVHSADLHIRRAVLPIDSHQPLPLQHNVEQIQERLQGKTAI